MEVLDLTEQCIRLSIVIRVPPTPQEIEDRKIIHIGMFQLMNVLIAQMTFT